MSKENTLRTLLALAAAAVLAGCGGGGGDRVGDAIEGAQIASFPTVLAQLKTPAGLTDPAVATAFDAGYRDAGMTRSDVVDALAAEATALSQVPEHSLFPQAALDGASLTDCDAQDVCTLTGTLRNDDADDTSVPFSTRVVRVGNAYRLLGDQAAS